MRLTIEAENGDVVHYGALSIMLGTDSDEWELHGSTVVKSLGYLCDLVYDRLVEDEDFDQYNRMVERLNTKIAFRQADET